MTLKVFIWLSENHAPTYRWGIDQQHTFQSMPHASLGEIASYLQNQTTESVEVVALLPGTTVFSSVINVPEQQAKYLQQALPFLVEEQLAEDIADMYLILGPKVAPTQYLILGMMRSLFESYLTRLESEGIVPHVMIADSSCCPLDTILVNADQTIACLSPNSFYAIDTVAAADFISNLLSMKQSSVVTWVLDQEAYTQSPLWLNSLEATVADQATVFQVRMADPLLSLLANEYLSKQHFYKAINFLQGQYARKLTKHATAGPWTSVIWVLCAALAIHWLFDMGQGAYFSFKTHQLENQTKAFYKSLFPNDTVSDNIKSQMVGKLKASEGDRSKHPFLETYSRIVTVLNAQKLTADFSVAQVSFNDEKGEVHLDVSGKNFDQLNQFKDALVKDGLQVEIGSATAETNSTKANLKVWQ